MSNRLDAKTAVVTGGAAGIGEATCLRLAEAGADVAAIDIDGPGAEATAQTIETDHDQTAIGIECDVGDPNAVEAMAETVNETFGTVEVLVNNAGIRVDPSPLTEVPEDRWDQILAVNLRGVARCAKFVIPLMENGGAVVNVASVGGLVGRPGWSLYDSTKGAIISLTQDMAHDHYDDDIRVNAVSPGWIITDYHIGDRTGEEAEEFLEEKTTPGATEIGIMERAGKPRELANAVLFLASDESSFMTGVNVPVDGGASVTGPI